ncbi:hypothetical protein NCER_102207 [Vairimorpha ceranae BRL01]|uniref:ATPase V1 complex subunit H C-terminal domain-containing protein n=2 Tax=Vairimorpha ceranae TaxID=40302 RepID=C4VBM2_VAIC1|nr:vacuolar h+-atpase v1 sector subunit h [Vairimorpha ceranae]EEQ81380.1 hypothetical protein NCER_102207 [Vairimorpha ceranae BRL01]KAF5140022.1 hypothetical protein G9O61_00g017470 [Vairimorpha ceranae]KKO75363.1 vacuolar h+-atpase v1 sector subunit h [Vairimorpha ceranae]
MAVYIETEESKLDFNNSNTEIDTALQSRDIKDLIEEYSSVEHLQYILYKYASYLDEDILLRLLKHRDTYISYKSFSLLTELYKKCKHKKEYIIFFNYMIMEDSTYEEKNQLLSLFVTFISCKSVKTFNLEDRKLEVINDERLISNLQKLITVRELQYNILLFLYVYSFSECYVEKVCTFLKLLIFILKDRSREKILRICYFILVNILNSACKLSINQIYELRKITNNLCESNISDEALTESLKNAHKILEKKHNEYTIENYVTDLFKGILEDHDYHYDEVFWSSGYPRISKNIVDIIKLLKKYLKSHNSSWICLACNDIYMLVKSNPQVHNLISKHKVRDVLYELTKSENDEIRFKAIQALYASIFSEWN